jgi:hypothetical protein
MAAQPLAEGSLARIFTGAPLPPGADAVVLQEDCTVLDASDGASPQVRVDVLPQRGQWIRRAGEDVGRGDRVLSRGTRLGPAELGQAAGVGMACLRVLCRPRVALFSTGDELVMPGACAPAEMPPGAIYNSNRFFLASLLRRLGCAVSDLGIVPDQRAATVAALREWIASGKPKDRRPLSPKGDAISKVRLATTKKVDVLVRDGVAERGEGLGDRGHDHERGRKRHHHLDERHAAAGRPEGSPRHSTILRRRTQSHTLWSTPGS